MRYYVVTTTKFADECLRYLTYGATQSNWLANIDVDDIIFLSQFNYKSQNLFGPFRVSKSLFYNKKVIFPQQRYFFRIQFKPMTAIKIIEETDLYLSGIKSKDIASYFKLINLIQQNKHLHCVCLTEDEGEEILHTFKEFGLNYNNNWQESKLSDSLIDINSKYIWEKDKIYKTHIFSSESDMESYVIISLKNTESKEYESLDKLLKKYPENDLHFSEIYNQFIFGNAYPADIAILNEKNINVFELKKDKLTNSIIPQIEKEIKKHLYYSLFSNRIKSDRIKRFNFYLVYLNHRDNGKFKQLISEKYNRLCNKIDAPRENNIKFIEYKVEDNILSLEEV